MSEHAAPPAGVRKAKREWRVRMLEARRAVPDEIRAIEARALSEAVVVATQACLEPVCCYVPVGLEPGSVRMLDALLGAGHEVLLPVVPPISRGKSTPSTLDWAPYRGAASLVDGPWGLRQPVAARLGPSALATAGHVLVPALAVDRHGTRLGRGAGWYDRSLPLARAATPIVAIVRDSELVAELPTDGHDVRMTGVLTPGLGLRALPLDLD
jgi:5-formyltetrahydrofolate cyclo-ligase